MNALKILSAGAVKGGVAQLAMAYSAERSVPVSVEFATAPELRQRMAVNAAADVLVAPPAVMDEVARAGGIVEGTRVFIGRSRMGVVGMCNLLSLRCPTATHSGRCLPMPACWCTTLPPAAAMQPKC